MHLLSTHALLREPHRAAHTVPPADKAASELSRLVKVYGNSGSNNLLGTLLLNGNDLGAEAATKLIQYAHW